MWSTWSGPTDHVGLSKLWASRAVCPRRFARHCGFTRCRPPPLRAGRPGARWCRTPDMTHRSLRRGKTSCACRSAARRRTAHRIRHTRRWCERPALCGAGVPGAHSSPRAWGGDGGADNSVVGRRAYSTSRASRARLWRTARSRPDHHANPHARAWVCHWTGSWLLRRRRVCDRTQRAFTFCRLAESTLGWVEQAEVDRSIAHEPTVGGCVDAHRLADQRVADVDRATRPSDLTVVAHLAHLVGRRIAGYLKSARVRPW